MYPNKKAKGHARKAFNKLKDAEQVAAINGVIAETDWRDAMATAGAWCPDWKHPATWLNGECWEDDLDVPDVTKTASDAPWQALISKLGTVGRNDYPSWDDPNISKALYRFTSWMAISGMTEKQLNFEIKPKFMDHYGRL